VSYNNDFKTDTIQDFNDLTSIKQPFLEVYWGYRVHFSALSEKKLSHYRTKTPRYS